jgi:hypothetical protein
VPATAGRGAISGELLRRVFAPIQLDSNKRIH